MSLASKGFSHFHLMPVNCHNWSFCFFISDS